MRYFLTLLSINFLLLLSTATSAQDSKVILSLSGYSAQLNQQVIRTFSYQQLMTLPQKTVVTTTNWTTGDTEFKGPLLRDVIALSKVSGNSLTAIAANDYSIDIPSEDFEKYDVILALEKNQKRLTLRTKGPIWLIYPWSDHAELQHGVYYSRSIWQLIELNSHD